MKKLSEQSAEALDLVLEHGVTSKRSKPVPAGVAMRDNESDELSRILSLLALLDDSTEGPADGLAERTVERIRRTPPPTVQGEPSVLFPGS